jgi:hypothetical protein
LRALSDQKIEKVLPDSFASPAASSTVKQNRLKAGNRQGEAAWDCIVFYAKIFMKHFRQRHDFHMTETQNEKSF